MNMEDMMKETGKIGYTTVIARLAGRPLTKAQKKMCARCDALAAFPGSSFPR